MSEPSELPPEPANLRFLRRLVTTLTAVMICGLLVIVTLFVIRFSSSPPALPGQITLPGGSKPDAFTVTRQWYGVVVDDGTRILIYDRATGQLRQEIAINIAPE